MKRGPRRKRVQLPLPPELCALICEEIGVDQKRDLLAICRVSPIFRVQVQRMIYHKVDLSDGSRRRLTSWCFAVTRRLELAERVHTLILGLDSDMSLTSDIATVARALAKCVNVKHLSVLDVTKGTRKFVTANECIQGWVLNNCTFRLEKFTNNFFKNSLLSQFWNVQSGIRILSLPSCRESFPCYADQLPNLIGLEVGRIQALPADRPLERLHLNIYPVFEGLATLSQYSPTLTALNLTAHHYAPEFTAREIFAKVALEVPGLLHFGFVERQGELSGSTEPSPIGVLARFERLETFFCYMHNIVRFDDDASGHWYVVMIAPHLEKFGRDTMAACTTLRRVTVAHDMQIMHKSLRRRGGVQFKDSELVCSLTRAGAGDAGDEILIEHEKHFDKDKTSMFWSP